MAWTAPKIHALLISLRPIRPTKPTGGVGKPIYGASPNTLAKQDMPSLGKRHS